MTKEQAAAKARLLAAISEPLMEGDEVHQAIDALLAVTLVRRIWQLVDEANMRDSVTKQDLIDKVMPVLIEAGMPSREWSAPPVAERVSEPEQLDCNFHALMTQQPDEEAGIPTVIERAQGRPETPREQHKRLARDPRWMNGPPEASSTPVASSSVETAKQEDWHYRALSAIAALRSVCDGEEHVMGSSELEAIARQAVNQVRAAGAQQWVVVKNEMASTLKAWMDRAEAAEAKVAEGAHQIAELNQYIDLLRAESDARHVRIVELKQQLAERERTINELQASLDAANKECEERIP